MLVSLTVPPLGDAAAIRTITRLHVADETAVRPGSPLFDVRVDLSAVAPQDCPPVSFFRVVSMERAWVRRVATANGSELQVGERVALLTTTADEPGDGTPGRALRTSTVGIVSDLDWFDEAEPA